MVGASLGTLISSRRLNYSTIVRAGTSSYYLVKWVQILKAIRTKKGVTFIPKTILKKTFDVTQDLTLHRAGFGHQAKFLISEFTGSVHRVSETSLLRK